MKRDDCMSREAFENYIELVGPKYRVELPDGWKRQTSRPEPADERYFENRPVIQQAEEQKEPIGVAESSGEESTKPGTLLRKALNEF